MKNGWKVLFSAIIISSFIFIAPGHLFGVEPVTEKQSRDISIERIPVEVNIPTPVQNNTVEQEPVQVQDLEVQRQAMIHELQGLEQSRQQEEAVAQVTADELESTIADLQTQIAEYEAEEEQRVYVLALQEDALAKSEELKRWEAILEEKKEALAQAQAVVGNMSDADILAMDVTIDENKADIAKIEKDIATTRANITSAQADLSQKEAALQTAINAYNAQAQVVSQQQAAVDQALAELQRAQFILQGTEDENARLQAQQNIDAAQALYQQAQAQLAAAQAETNTAQQAVNVAQADVNAVQTQIAGLEAQIASYNQQIENVKATELNKCGLTASLTAAQQALQKAQNEYNTAKSNYDKAKKEKEDADKKVTDINNQLKTLKTKSDAAQTKLNKGSLGYFQSMGYTSAANVLLGKDKTYRSEYASRYTEALKRTSIGAAKDATSLENLKASVTVLQNLNKYRKQEGVATVSVDPYLMAICELQTNWSSNVIAHSKIYNVGENLAWGYTDPFAGWYTKEKALAQAHPEYMNSSNANYEKVGHYVNIRNTKYKSAGAAVNQKSNAYIRTWGTTFQYNSTGISVDAFAKSVNNYYNSVMNDINAYNDALKKQTELKNTASSKATAYNTANTKLNTANTAFNNAKNSLNSVNSQIAAKEKELMETNAQIQSLKAQITDTQSEKASLTRVDLAQAQNRLDQAEGVLQDKKNQQAIKQTQVQQAYEFVLDQEDVLNQMYGSRERAYQQVLDKQQQLSNQQVALAEKEAVLKTKENAVKNAQTRVQSAQNNLEKHNTTLSGLNAELRVNQQILANNENTLNAMKQSRHQSAVLLSEIEDIVDRIVDLQMDTQLLQAVPRATRIHNIYLEISNFIH